MNEITIIVANYNNNTLLPHCFASLLNQTTKDFNVIVCDDGSTDNSIKFIEAISHLFDEFEYFSHSQNMGYTYSLIQMLKRVRTPLVGILDSDDALAPHAIRFVLKAYNEHHEVGFVYTNFYYCDAELRPQRLGYCKEIPKHKTNLDCDCVSHFKTFKMDAYRQTTGYDLKFRYAQDKDLVYKMEEKTKLFFINDPLYLLRRGHKNAINFSPLKRKQSKKFAEQAKADAEMRRAK